jgi:hypothetical protein
VLDIFIIITLLCGLACMLAFTAFVISLVLDRVLDETLPRLVELYARWRYPREFTKQTRDYD